MEQSIFEIVRENTPFTALCIAIAIVSGWVVNRFMRFNTRLEKTELAVTDLGDRVTKVEKRLDAVETRLVIVETKLDALDKKVEKISYKVDKLADKLDRLIEVLLVKNKES
jgi:uncharacterized coiled-coil protein SlyX